MSLITTRGCVLHCGAQEDLDVWMTVSWASQFPKALHEELVLIGGCGNAGGNMATSI